jgi:hypothetical protein
MFNPAFINNNNDVVFMHVFETKILLLIPIIVNMFQNMIEIVSSIISFIIDNHERIISITYIVTSIMSFCSMMILLNQMDRNLKEKIQRKKERQQRKEQDKKLEQEKQEKQGRNK